MNKKWIFPLLLTLTSASALAGVGRGESKLLTLTSLPPDVPVLGAPANGASVSADSMVCLWHPMPHVIRYHLLVSKQAFFSNPDINEMNITDTTFTLRHLERNTEYYWCLRAVNAAGYSDWSQIRIFTTSLASLASPVLSYPPDGSGGIPPTCEFRWSAVTDAASYHLQVFEQAVSEVLVVDHPGIPDTRFPAVLESGKTYRWRVAAAGAEGEGPYSLHWTFNTSSTDVERTGQTLPDVFALHPAFPNPFNSTVSIVHDAPESAVIELALFNASGQSVKILVSGTCPPGRHVIRWDGTDCNGVAVPSGLYICRMKAGKQVFIQKLMLMR